MDLAHCQCGGKPALYSCIGVFLPQGAGVLYLNPLHSMDRPRKTPGLQFLVLPEHGGGFAGVQFAGNPDEHGSRFHRRGQIPHDYPFLRYDANRPHQFYCRIVSGAGLHSGSGPLGPDPLLFFPVHPARGHHGAHHFFIGGAGGQTLLFAMEQVQRSGNEPALPDFLRIHFVHCNR